MQHEAKRNRAAAFFLAVVCLLGPLASARAQASLQHAMLRSAAPAAAGGEDAAPAPASSVAAALQQIAVQAAVIFTGSVTEVRADGSGGGARITFAVEQPLRGIAPGAGYSMHVSAWAGGTERFHSGERALFLLTAPSSAGFSAPVMGERGIIPLSGDALVGNLDLRWIAADVQRGSPAPLQSPAPLLSAMAIAANTPPAASIAGQPRPEYSDATTTFVSATMPDVHSIDRDLVLGLLRSGNAAAEAR